MTTDRYLAILYQVRPYLFLQDMHWGMIRQVPPPGHELDLQGFGNVACAPENILKRIVFCTIDVA